MTTPSRSDIGEASAETQLALLKKITELTNGTGYSQSHHIKSLAEAYAWIRSPNQPHGSAASSD